MDIKITAPKEVVPGALEGCFAIIFYSNKVVVVQAQIEGLQLTFPFKPESSLLKKVIVVSSSDEILVEINTGVKDEIQIL